MKINGQKITGHDFDEIRRLQDGKCAWCETAMNEGEIDYYGRVTCSDRCRQARHRWRKREGLPT